jgi:hypothetical protein
MDLKQTGRPVLKPGEPNVAADLQQFTAQQHDSGKSRRAGILGPAQIDNNRLSRALARALGKPTGFFVGEPLGGRKNQRFTCNHCVPPSTTETGTAAAPPQFPKQSSRRLPGNDTRSF